MCLRMKGKHLMKKWLTRLRLRFFATCPRTGRLKGMKLCSLFRLLLFPVLGLAAVIWILIRIVPKPDRAAYPCMKVAAPIASGFLIYVAGLASSVYAFRKARQLFAQSKIRIALVVLSLAISTSILTFLQHNKNTLADAYDYQDPLGPNNPIGKAKGIFPGRVVWVHDADATNETCIPYEWNDGYFLDKNCDQSVVNRMLADGLLALSGKSTEKEAWDAIFAHFNSTHNKGNVGYSEGEIIFIKINSVHASSGSMTADYSIRRNDSYGFVDTSPHAVLALLRQLVYKAGVPQENIYVGDPFRDIFKHCFDKWHDEFPQVNYQSQSAQEGRVRFVRNSTKKMFYSDKKTVLEVDSEAYYKIISDADYIINLPAYKGHRWGGVTFFAKNFFGTITRSDAVHLHKGLHRTDYDQPLRTGYRQYRVFVDIMGNKTLGGKTLLYMMDGLWATSYEHDPPVKFQSPPFNNDWCSSIFVSLDAVAIESVCLDVMQAEFTEEDLSVYPPRYTYVRFDGMDDYLHQAADSTWWPEGITYDPENDGTPIGSLGVHEHWNNPIDRQYSRNLATTGGIELVEISRPTAVEEKLLSQLSQSSPAGFVLHQNYPNPFNPSTTIVYDLSAPAKVQLSVFNIHGQIVSTLSQGYQLAGKYSSVWNGRDERGSVLPSGIYLYQLRINDGVHSYQSNKNMVLVK